MSILTNPKAKDIYLGVYMGPMFAGKTSRLIDHYNTVNVINDLERVAFKFDKDTRYESDNSTTLTDIDLVRPSKIYSHDKTYIPCIPISSCWDIIEKLKYIKATYNITVKYIFIDEGQFFPEIKEWYNNLLNIISNPEDTNYQDYNIINNIDEIVISGLDYDSTGNIFNKEFYSLAEYADYLLVAASRCYICNGSAKYTILLDKNNNTNMNGNVLIGDNTIYQPACSTHCNFNIDK